MEQLRIGIIATGGIAHKFANTVIQMKEAVLTAVSSRTIDKAEAFAREFAIPHAYGDYLDLSKDPNVDLVYIGSPHQAHYQQAYGALSHGKHVLCEKALCTDAKQAQDLMNLAKAKGLLLCEALWTRFQPLTKEIFQLANSGIIGTPSLISVGHGQILTHVPRLVDPKQAGGALLDLTVYPIHLAFLLFGPDYSDFVTKAQMYQTGVDAVDQITLTYANDRMALLSGSLLHQMSNLWHIYGDQGTIEVNGHYHPLSYTVYDKDRQVIQSKAKPADEITGYEYEVLACKSAIEAGLCECPQMPWRDSLKALELCDALRAVWGLRFPFES
ncbi:MAG: Gfo/Idh/MocA family oxidoreductase [Erysipelotrichaceae bacterium]|jgi:predicted dehydrogenase|nr:Gfo/Idh/MocA family oxidoreductase [Erysipelotrichaceae bacterium]